MRKQYQGKNPEPAAATKASPPCPTAPSPRLVGVGDALLDRA